MSSNRLPQSKQQPSALNFGVLSAFSILFLWGSVFIYAIFFHELSWSRLPVTVLLILLLTFLNTGLFITAHDAMHGVVSPRKPGLNHGIGALCVFLYAGFNYRFMLREHHQHHAHAGIVSKDPDFHADQKPSYLAWYLHFFAHYFRWWQLAGILVIAVSMQVFWGAAQWNPLTFWALPGILSSFQLFTFGTWLPHREEAVPFNDRHRARSNQYPPWLSLLTCYHFGYHWEHHEWPYIPWWSLPKARAERLGQLEGKV
jgi:beta-carotene ketolase (CrtW type)